MIAKNPGRAQRTTKMLAAICVLFSFASPVVSNSALRATTYEEQNERKTSVTTWTKDEVLPDGVYRVPTYMLIGAPKCGTTTLARNLMKHSLVNKWQRKEQHFFDSEESETEAFATTKYFPFPPESGRTYKSKWTDQNGSTPFRDLMTFDATPNYLFDSFKIFDKIKRQCPWVKFIISLRNPVERAYSAYVMELARWPKRYSRVTFDQQVRMDIADMRRAGLLPRMQKDKSDPSIPLDSLSMPEEFYGSDEEEQAWKTYLETRKKYPKALVARGMYALQLRFWLREFPRDQFIIFNYDRDLKGNEDGIKYTSKRMMDFLGLPEEVLPQEKTFNKGKYSLAEAMLPETRAMLEEIYRPYNNMLSSMLGTDWNDVWPDTTRMTTEALTKH